MIQFGLRLHDAEKLPIEQVLPLVRQKGFSCVHLALSKSLKEVPNTSSALTPGYAAYLRRLFAKNELDIAVLGNYLNLAHPDTDALHAIQEKYYAHIRFASLLGCGMVGTETGAPNAEYKFCPECRSDAALAAFIKNFKPVVRCAEQYGVTIAIEPVKNTRIRSNETRWKCLCQNCGRTVEVSSYWLRHSDPYGHCKCTTFSKPR